ncbi:MAG: alpha/beta hydrolase fold domain-containing protein [Xanthobacteraceae bacterium]
MRCLSWVVLVVAELIASIAAAQAQPYSVSVRTELTYAEHDGIKLSGDLYLPKGRERAPVMLAVHGGGWQGGGPELYRYWGPFMAKNGIGLYAIRYRLSKPGVKTYPGAVYDVKAAVQFLGARANELGIDGERIGMMGDSAGAHLTSLAALAADEFTSEYRNDPHADTPTHVKAVVGFYGVYDMQAQWLHDQITRPRDQITEKFLGLSPMQSRRTYFDASPISYATIDKREKLRTRFLLIHGTADDIVDPQTQAQAFLTALKQAGFYARTIVVPGSGHFWAAEPVEEPGSYGAQAAPQLLRFVQAAFQ